MCVPLLAFPLLCCGPVGVISLPNLLRANGAPPAALGMPPRHTFQHFRTLSCTFGHRVLPAALAMPPRHACAHCRALSCKKEGALGTCVLVAELLTRKPSLGFYSQGDAEDRRKLRKKAEEDARRKAEEEKQDMVLEEAEALARMVSSRPCCGFSLVEMARPGSCGSRLDVVDEMRWVVGRLIARTMVLEEVGELARMVSRLFGPVWLGALGSCSNGDGRGRLRR